jgi:hypothetical protein
MGQTRFPICLFTTALVACVACVAPAAQPAGYRIEAVTFNHSTARVGNLELTLDNPDDPERPTMWEGPVRIRGTSGTCEAAPSLVTKVLIDSTAQTLVIISASGSRTFVDFVATATCRPRWPRMEVATDGISVAGDRLTILSACEENGARARCTSARIYELRPYVAPRLLEPESRQLTKINVGVEFSGEAWVVSPRTSNARLSATP